MRTGAEAVQETPGGARAPHEHEMRLVAVTHDDGFATSEYVCAGCGSTWFA